MGGWSVGRLVWDERTTLSLHTQKECGEFWDRSFQIMGNGGAPLEIRDDD